MSRAHRCIVFVCLATGVGLCAPESRAQGLEKIATPIEVHVAAPSAPHTPADKPGKTVVPRGTTVGIYGTSVPNGKTLADRKVTLTVKPPSGAPLKWTADLSIDGTWSTTFPETGTVGEYGVTAVAPDGKASASTSFTVAASSDILATIEIFGDELEEDASTADAGAQAAQTSLAAKGPFPGQEQVTQNLNQIAAALKEMPARVQAAKQALAKLDEIAKKYPGGAAELEPITTAISEGAKQFQPVREKLQAATAAVGKSSGLCDRIDAVNEVLSAGSLMFDLQGLLFAKVVQLAADKYLPDKIYNAAVPPAQRNNADKFGLAENLKAAASAFTGGVTGGKAGAAGGLIEFVKKPQNLFLDTVQLLGGMAFDKFCEKFTGPVTGTFKVDATVNGSRFWGYTTLINGMLTLRYEKSNPKAGEAIPVTGEFEGNGAFSVYEDLMAMNAFNRQFVIYRQLFQPVGMSAAAVDMANPLGKIGRSITPGYFRVPVTGSIAGTQLTLKVGEAAQNDFSAAVKGRAVYVLVSPAVPLPYTMASTIPLQKAQFIISRGLRTTAVMPIVTTTAGKAMIKTVTGTFDRKEVVSNGEVTVTWKIQLKACNPGCGG